MDLKILKLNENDPLIQLIALPRRAILSPRKTMQLSPGDHAMTAMTAPAKAPSDALLLEIATKHFHSIETLEIQNSDRLDFHDVAVWAIRASLNEAYAAGLAAATKR
jgi:hypothetical protein